MYETQDHSGHRPPFSVNGPQRFGKPVEMGRLFRAVLRAKWWLIGIMVIGGAAGVAVAQFLISKEYMAKAILVWEPKGLGEPSQLQTLVDQVKIDTNTREVRRRLGLKMKLSSLASKIDVLASEESHNVTITARSDTAEGAAALANTMVEVYLANQAEQAKTRAQDRVNRLTQDLRVAQQTRDDARRRYDDFRRERGIVDIETETQRAIEEAAELSAQATLLLERRSSRASNTAGGVRVDGALAERIRAKRAELAEAQTTYTDEHPRVQQLKFQLRTLEEQARAAAEAAEANPPTPNNPRPRPDAAAAASTSVSSQIQERLARLSQAEGDASKLLAEVRVAEAHVTELDAEVARAQDEARQARAEFRLISEADPPDDAKSYKRPVAIAFPIVFLFFAILVILARELWGFYVYTANEVAFWGRGPVVGSSTWPAGPHTLKSLTQELGDLIPKAIGMTLVIPTSREDELLAEAVAGRLQLFANAMAAPDPEAALDEAETRIFVDVRQDAQRAGEPIDAVIVDPSTGAPITPPAPGSGGGTGRHHALALAHGNGGLPMAYNQGSPPALSQNPGGNGGQNLLRFTAWKGALEGPHLRGAARQVDRVLVVVASGKVSVAELGEIRTQLGRDDGVAFLVVGLPPDLAKLPDRSGPVEAFWLSRR